MCFLFSENDDNYDHNHDNHDHDTADHDNHDSHDSHVPDDADYLFKPDDDDDATTIADNCTECGDSLKGIIYFIKHVYAVNG